MKILSVNINNFRSIQNVTIPFLSYGSKLNKSNTAFLVGINESGKSAILEAISLINKGLADIDYEKDCFLEAQEEDDFIDIYAEIDIENTDFYRKQISERLKLEESFVKRIEFISLNKNIYRNSETVEFAYDIKINDDLPFFLYAVITEQKTISNKLVSIEVIKKISDINASAKIITKENAKSFLNENQKLLTKEIFERLIVAQLQATFEVNLPKIQMWRPSTEYLINETISLEEFSTNTKISIPLKNIFNIFGKVEDSAIKETIDRALKNQARKDELQNKMSSEITKHINKIWKEHKINIRISINGSDCQVHVEDKDKEFAYYTMNQRSDGFRQFISLILSLSAQNASNKLKNTIILIDEPEVHLHPSGVRYMRDEILKIGKNNFVFVATHSHYMVDTNCPERHWIVTKKETQTTISQINEDTPTEDDAVLASAFGLNLFKELLPKHIIIVEGVDDKSVITHALNKLNNKFFYSIKTAKGASKAYGIASLLAEENISAFFLFDDDKEGRDYKKKIIDNYPTCFSDKNVFTLRDIHGTLPLKCTLEDLMPLEFVKAFFDKELSTDLTLNNLSPFIKQITDQNRELRENKQKLDSLKVKLSNNFIGKFDTKNKLDAQVPELVNLVQGLVRKLEQ